MLKEDEMRKLIAVVMSIITSICHSKCPTCGEECIGGAHPGGYHGCSQGHAW
jgi:hypothetical protein